MPNFRLNCVHNECTIRIVKFMSKGRNELKEKHWNWKSSFCFLCEDTKFKVVAPL